MIHSEKQIIAVLKEGEAGANVTDLYRKHGVSDAYATERIMPGVVYMDHGSRCDWIIPGKLDRGGAINLISPTKLTSKNVGGMVTSGYLVEVEKVTLAPMEE